MAGEDTAALLRQPDAPKRATLLELLLDVVYVAALALISMRLADDVNWLGAARVLVLLMAVWWIWSITALLTDFYNPEQLGIQLVVAWAMFGSIVMTAALPHAFRQQGWVFAGIYVGIHVGRGIVLVALLRGHEAQARAARFLLWFVVSGVAWIAGAFLPSPMRLALWAVALMIDYVGAALRYPTPRLGRVPLYQYDKASEHLGERYQQFIILALGDIILVPVVQNDGRGFSTERLGGLLLAFATMLLLWHIYVYRAGAFLQVAIRRGPGRTTRWAPYTHMLMVAGIVSTSAGFELVINGSRSRAGLGWVMVVVGGPTLFLIGRTVFEYEIFGRFSWSRLLWLVVLVGIAPLLVSPPLIVAAAVTGVALLGVGLSDAIRAKRMSAPGGHSTRS
ncbi:low temperature requirement protein A [Plantactinospora sp. S1510]|uniref:Low temperature requirement protein A n=1 Tax=Plantactinospora alkalitolerans TaxID=2789879 RepID=A0ABS0GZW1_9ACTN|nr:low temperature requirement protein A [Plantactinospora alkalitolerans]MBF9131743.1 low temperature requirement protein A [Plantactinospora alkalitolerans]